MTYAQPQDVAEELTRPASSLTASESAAFSAWLRRAEAIIKLKVSDLDTRVASGDLDAATVVSVEAAVVARRALNWQGLRSVSTTIDDGTVQKTRDSSLSDGVLRLTDDEWALLLPRRRRGAFSITPRYSGA